MIQNKIEQLIKPVIEDMGYIFWGCEYSGQGKHSLLRVYIDKNEGIGITDCEKVSRQISATLDVEDPISGHYNLEVSSPGIPRPLLARQHYELYTGKEVNIKLYQPVEGKRKYTGVIIAVTDDRLTLAVNGLEHNFPFSNITRANLTV